MSCTDVPEARRHDARDRRHPRLRRRPREGVLRGSRVAARRRPRRRRLPDRPVQPAGSGCSIQFGSASRRPHPGPPSTSSSCPTSRPRTTSLVAHGVDAEVFHELERRIQPLRRERPGERSRSRTEDVRVVRRVPRPRRQRLAAAGDHRPAARPRRRDRRDVHVRRRARASTQARRRPRTASTRSARVSGTRSGRPGTPRSCWRSRPAPSRRSERLRRHRPRRRRAGRALRGRPRRRRPPRRRGRTRARGRRVLVLGVHPVQDAAAPGRGRARGERGCGDAPRSTSRPRSPGATTWCRATPTRVPRSGSPTTAST